MRPDFFLISSLWEHCYMSRILFPSKHIYTVDAWCYTWADHYLRQLFAGHGDSSWPMKRKKEMYQMKNRIWLTLAILLTNHTENMIVQWSNHSTKKSNHSIKSYFFTTLHYVTLQIRCTLQIIHYKNSTVSRRPQIAKANRGGWSYTQSVVKLVIKYNNITLHTTISD